VSAPLLRQLGEVLANGELLELYSAVERGRTRIAWAQPRPGIAGYELSADLAVLAGELQYQVEQRMAKP